jgi:hypothetical protein
MMEKTSTKLLVIVIATAAIIAMATTTSISAATPAFAKINERCDASSCTFVGGTSNKKEDIDTPGGHGGRAVLSESGQVITNNGGFGQNLGTSVGGSGFRLACDPICTQVGTPEGRGLHPK